MAVADLQETDPAGRRRDAAGYGAVLEQVDTGPGELITLLDAPNNRLVVTGDHRNDPTLGSGHRTRAFVPVLMHRPESAGSKALPEAAGLAGGSARPSRCRGGTRPGWRTCPCCGRRDVRSGRKAPGEGPDRPRVRRPPQRRGLPSHKRGQGTGYRRTCARRGAGPPGRRRGARRRFGGYGGDELVTPVAAHCVGVSLMHRTPVAADLLGRDSVRCQCRGLSRCGRRRRQRCPRRRSSGRRRPVPHRRRCTPRPMRR
ncbi:hypothetical protein [Streptomyces sp. NK08204]|uniref:hypothetical protein n=1 Tax=Streptomyces sp. NK08204 TaxID=2873260 RepID=UPI001CED2013